MKKRRILKGMSIFWACLFFYGLPAEWTVIGTKAPIIENSLLCGDPSQRFVLENDLRDARSVEFQFQFTKDFKNAGQPWLNILLGDGPLQQQFIFYRELNHLSIIQTGKLSSTNLLSNLTTGPLTLSFKLEKNGLSLEYQGLTSEKKSEKYLFPGKKPILSPLIFVLSRGLDLRNINFYDSKNRPFFTEDFKNPVFHFVDLTRGKSSGEGKSDLKGGGKLF